MTHWKRPWCWERLRAGGEGDDRGWDGWMASLTQWTRVWVDSGSWWWTGRPGVLRFMESQRVGHDWATELNWTELLYDIVVVFATHSHESAMGVHVFPILTLPPSHLPPHPIPLGSLSAPALSALFHALNLGWRSVSHVVIHVSVLFSQIIPPSPSPTESSVHYCIDIQEKKKAN